MSRVKTTKTPDDWGYPRFAESFPADDDLEALILAFARGDYRAVRDGVPALKDKPEDVAKAAKQLLAATEPDPTAKLLFAMTGVLLVFLFAWWVTHDGPRESAPASRPTVEHVK